MFGNGHNLNKLPVLPKVLVDFNSLKKLREKEQFCLTNHQERDSDMAGKRKETEVSKQEDLQRSQQEQLKEKSYEREIVQSGASNKAANEEDLEKNETFDEDAHAPLSIEASLHFLHFVPKAHVGEARQFLESLINSKMFALSSSGNLIVKDGTDLGNFVALLRHMYGDHATEKHVKAVYSTLSNLLPNFSFRRSEPGHSQVRNTRPDLEEKEDWYKIL